MDINKALTALLRQQHITEQELVQLESKSTREISPVDQRQTSSSSWFFWLPQALTNLASSIWGCSNDQERLNNRLKSIRKQIIQKMEYLEKTLEGLQRRNAGLLAENNELKKYIINERQSLSAKLDHYRSTECCNCTCSMR